MEKVGSLTEADFVQLDAGEKKEIVKEPLLITDCAKAVQGFRDMNRVKAQIAMFRSQLSTTSHVKATGRAQMPITAADQIDENICNYDDPGPGVHCVAKESPRGP